MRNSELRGTNPARSADHRSASDTVQGPTALSSNARRYGRGQRLCRRGGYQPPADMVRSPTGTGGPGSSPATETKTSPHPVGALHEAPANLAQNPTLRAVRERPLRRRPASPRSADHWSASDPVLRPKSAEQCSALRAFGCRNARRYGMDSFQFSDFSLQETKDAGFSQFRIRNYSLSSQVQHKRESRTSAGER